MAIRMRAWLVLVVGSCVAVAASLLPPERLELAGPDELPEQVRYEAVLSELRRAHMALQLTRWSDSLSALLLSEPSARETEMRLGAFWQPVAHGALPNVPLGVPVLASVTFADVGGELPYCFTVHTRPGSQDDFDGLSLADLPDPCRMLSRFGAPGAHIGGWLERGAWGFGSSLQPVPDYARLRDRSYAEWPFFGTRRHPLATGNAFTGGCLAGDPAACARAIVDPVGSGDASSELRNAAAASPVSYVDLDWSDESSFGYLDDSLFAELEEQFGVEAFARFWSSDEEVHAAFADAFGVGLGDWVRAWVDEQMGISRAGPSIPLGDLLLAVLTISALTAMASRVGMRRRVA